MEVKGFAEFLKGKTEEFIEVTKNIKDIGNFRAQRFSHVDKQQISELKKKYKNMLNSIERSIRELSKSLNQLKTLEWNKFNIVFFGETNAGKSTLIEALIGGSGESIGDARKDFTKRMRILKYDTKVNLIDTPGIEGNEKKVINAIQGAVNKAHAVFYVFPDNKEPEEGTLHKIKSFLNEHAYIYGVLNVRGNIKNKEQFLKKFNSKSVKTIEDRTRTKLIDIFGNRFKEIFRAHALYAFYARAKEFKPASENASIFVSQQKARRKIEAFNGRENLEQLSNIKALIDEIQVLKKNSQIKILWINTRKILSKQEEIIFKILSNKKDLDEYIKGLEDALRKLLNKYKSESETLKANINRIIETSVEELKQEMRREAYALIDEGEEDEEVYRDKIEEVYDERIDEIRREIEQEIKEFKRRIHKEIKLLEERIQEFGNFVSTRNADIESIVKAFKVDVIKEATKGVLKAAGVIIAFTINPIFGAIAFATSIISTILDWIFGSEDRKAEAKRKANIEIGKIVKKIKRDLKNEIRQNLKVLEQKIEEIEGRIENERRAVLFISSMMQQVVNKLILIHQEIGEGFLKTLDRTVKFGYIQTSLKEGDHVCAVCPSENLRDKLIGCGIENISIYKNGEDMLSDIKEREEEFFKRLRNFLKSKELNYGKKS